MNPCNPKHNTPMRTYSSRNSDPVATGCVGVLIMWWQGAIIGFVPYLGRLSIPAAVVTWLLMLILL